jgi:PHD/YefM family antitoxin component YafN of YafNO toxin-antitoxin module
MPKNRLTLPNNMYYNIYNTIYYNMEKNMLVEAKQMVPITRLQKELTQTVRKLSDSGKAVYILKNNNMEAVLLSFQEYEHLKTLEEMFERYEIKEMIETRMKKYNPKNNISYEDVGKRIKNRK